MKKARARPAVTEEDARLFRDAVKDAVPLGLPARAVHTPRRPNPRAVQRERDEREALADSLSDHIPFEAAMETGEEAVFLRNGLGRDTLRKLRRGHWIIQDELDLHGLTTAQARPLLAEFLGYCRLRGLRCVRVIHGKGLRSKNREPVLKARVAHWLMQRDEVLAYCQARAADGGGGAMLVLLKSPGRPAPGADD